MNKIFLIVISILSSFFSLLAQEVQLPSYALKADYNKRTYFGLKAGINFPRFYYTNKYLQDLPHDLIISPSISAFVEMPFNATLSIAPELNYQQKGGATSYLYEQSYNVSYNLNAHYTSLRFPVNCYFPVHPSLRPYILLGPDIGYVIGGKIVLTQPGLEIPESMVAINNSNINRVYLGGICGIGLRFNLELPKYTLILKADAALNFSINDTFTKDEHNDTATPTNVNAYYIHDRRFSQGLEIHFSIGHVPYKKDDICDHFHFTKKIPFDFE